MTITPAEFSPYLAAHGGGRPAVSDEATAAFLELADETQVDVGQTLVRQFTPATHLFLLLDGEVRFEIQLDEGNENLDVGISRARWTPIGWSGFRTPHRYATTVRTMSACRLLRFEHAALSRCFAEQPALGVLFLEGVLAGSLALLSDVRGRLAGSTRTPANFADALQREGEEEAYNRAAPPLLTLLRRSAFFEVFTERHLDTLAATAESRYFCRGEPIVEQDARDPGLWVLATGRVALNYRPPGAEQAFALRTLTEPGAIVTWAGLGGVTEHSTAVVATRDCTVYRIDPTALAPALDTDPRLAFALTRRLLWLSSNHLRTARALFISRRFEQEILAIRNVLEQSCTQFNVGSPLHRLPHLLENALTLGDAFAAIEALQQSPDALERNLAQLCGDMLGEVRREHDFFEALRRVYHAVVTAPRDRSPRDVRALCAGGFREAFRQVRSVVEGEHHLPDGPGHIFIFNHLKNHEYNTLPNNFQLTLDSHFVSAMILDPRYGDSGIRVVRESRGTEYGHQAYYDRLGHLSVYTRESDEIDESREERRTRLDAFFGTAGAHLKARTNVILSPEGTSCWTEDSPGPFKAGAFRLAASVEPEPRIVPIAVANFDRRVHSTVYAVVIKPPFRLSDVMQDPRDPTELQTFLVDYQTVYARYVREARALAGSADSV